MRVRLTRGLLFVCGAVRAGFAPAAAQSDSLVVPIPLVEEFLYDGQVAEWRARPLDHVLEPSAGRPQALIWVGQVDDGLVVAAEVRRGSASTAPATLAITLSGSEPPQFPPIGWGHQFGFEVLADSTSCVDSDLEFAEGACLAWYHEQRAHQDRIRPLFERRWHVELEDPGSLTEALARPAFEALADADRVAALSPRGQPGALTREIKGTTGGVGLEMLIPWSAFPPVRAPDLDAVRIMVEWVTDPSPDDVSTDLWDQPARPLALPLRHTTPCGAGLAGLLIPRDGAAPRRASPDAVRYMIPVATGDLRDVIIIDNHAAGYQYTPEPETRSPQAFETKFQALEVADEKTLCAPILALADGDDRVSPEDWTHTGIDESPVGYVDLDEIEVRELDDGNLLVLSGPRVWSSYYGSGQCGACPRVGVEIFHVTMATGEIQPALRYLNIAEPGTRDVEIEVSEDWREVRTYASSVTDFETDPIEIRWSFERYCLTETSTATYEKCGEEEDVPEPPVLLRRLYRVP